jgi:hypothetical protein
MQPPDDVAVAGSLIEKTLGHLRSHVASHGEGGYRPDRFIQRALSCTAAALAILKPLRPSAASDEQEGAA